MEPRAEFWRAVGAAAVVAVTAVALAGCASEPFQEARAESTAILKAAVHDDDAPGCSAAVAIDGQIVWAEARGVASTDTGHRLRPLPR